MPEIIGMLFPEHKDAVPDLWEHPDALEAAEAQKVLAMYVAGRIREHAPEREVRHLLIQLDDGSMVSAQYSISIPKEQS